MIFPIGSLNFSLLWHEKPARLIHRHFSVEATSAASAEIIFDVIFSGKHLSN